MKNVMEQKDLSLQSCANEEAVVVSLEVGGVSQEAVVVSEQQEIP